MAEGRTRRGLQIFTRSKPVYGDLHKQTGTPPVWDQAAVDATPEFFACGGSAGGILFSDPEGTEESCLNVSWLRLGANYHLPRHSHTSDCLYYVTDGEIRLGNKAVHAGEGFFVPEGAPYTYMAGPDGAEILEFRGTARPIGTQILEKDWDRILETSRASRDRWQEELRQWSQWMRTTDSMDYQTPNGERKSISIKR
jgi:hypothetical protein